jgi:hypothetical protein
VGRIYIYNKKRVGVHTPSVLLLWLGSRATRARLHTRILNAQIKRVSERD